MINIFSVNTNRYQQFWWQMLHATFVGDKLSLITIRCWWRFWPFKMVHFAKMTLALGTSIQQMSPTSKSNSVTNIHKTSPTLRHQHIWRQRSVKLTNLFWRKTYFGDHFQLGFRADQNTFSKVIQIHFVVFFNPESLRKESENY